MEAKENPVSAKELIARFDLEPHPEGGYYKRIYRSETEVRRGRDTRAAISTIYYLLQEGQHGRWHEVASDEIWHFLAGDPLELITYDPRKGTKNIVTLGPAARALGRFTLAGCTVGPGFDFSDFRFVADLPGHETHFATALAEYRYLL